MAAPHVTGVAGLVWAAKPSLTAAQVKNILVATADRPLSYSHGTYKILNANKAVEMAKGIQDTISGSWISNTINTTYISVSMALTLSKNGGAITGTGSETVSSPFCGPLYSSTSVTGTATGQLVTLNITNTSAQQTCQGTGQWLGYSLTTSPQGRIATITADISNNSLIVTSAPCSVTWSGSCVGTYTDFSKQ